MTLPGLSNYSLEERGNNNENNNNQNSSNNFGFTISNNNNNNYYASPHHILAPRRSLLANTQEISIITSLEDLYQLNLASPSPPASLNSSTSTLQAPVAQAPEETTGTTNPSSFFSDDLGLLLESGENGHTNDSSAAPTDESDNSAPTAASNHEQLSLPQETPEETINHQYSAEITDTSAEDCSIAFCDGNGSVDFDKIGHLNHSSDSISEMSYYEQVQGEDTPVEGAVDNEFSLALITTTGDEDGHIGDLDGSLDGVEGLQHHQQHVSMLTPQQIILQHVLHHQLLPHFQRVVLYLKKNGFLANIVEEDVRVQQQYMQGNIKGVSLEKFLMSYDVTCPSEEPPEEGSTDDEMLRKIYKLKKVYDEEMVNLDNACNSFVSRMRLLQVDHSKIVPVSEQQVLAKTLLIQNKFGYLRKQLRSNICNAMLTVIMQKITKLKAPATPSLRTSTIYLTPPQPTPEMVHSTTSTTTTTPTINTPTTTTPTTTPPQVELTNSTEIQIQDFELPMSNYDGDDANDSEITSSSSGIPPPSGYDDDITEDESSSPQQEHRRETESPKRKLRAKETLRGKRKKKALHKNATDVLNPYPSENEKKTMASSLGLHINQVNNWFGNKRIRHKRRLQEMAEIQQRQIHNQYSR